MGTRQILSTMISFADQRCASVPVRMTAVVLRMTVCEKSSYQQNYQALGAVDAED